MKPHPKLTLIVALSFALLAPAFAQSTADVGLQDIADLATVNGQALACQDMPIAQRAKSLMLSHAPKTDKYGSAFTDGTNNSYLAQTRSAQPCPATSVLSSQLDTLAIRLQSSLPLTSASSQ